MTYDEWFSKLLNINVSHGEYGLDHPMGSCCYRDVMRHEKVREALKVAWKEIIEDDSGEDFYVHHPKISEKKGAK